MTKQLTKQTIGVGVAGTGFIGPAHVESLIRIGTGAWSRTWVVH